MTCLQEHGRIFMNCDLPQGPVNASKMHVQNVPALWSCCSVRTPGKTSGLKKATRLRLLRALLRNQDPESYDLVHDRLGRPLLLRNGIIGAGISFSYCNGTTWVALAIDRSNIGIDAEQANGFGPDYPFHRVFDMDGSGEFMNLMKEYDDRDQCAALLWSAKEAFVKALGCGFHFFSPREVDVSPLRLAPSRALLRAGLSDKGQGRLDPCVPSQMRIDSFRKYGAWISIGIME